MQRGALILLNTTLVLDPAGRGVTRAWRLRTKGTSGGGDQCRHSRHTADTAPRCTCDMLEILKLKTSAKKKQS